MGNTWFCFKVNKKSTVNILKGPPREIKIPFLLILLYSLVRTSAIFVLQFLHGKVHPCVLHAIFTTWANAWCTDRRFQQDLRDCVLCQSCKGKDELEHYLVCRHGFSALRPKLRLQVSPNHAARAMLLVCKSGDDLIFSAVALYAVRGVVHKMRAQSRRASNVQKHLWEQVRIAARYSGSLRKKLESLWASS